MSSSMVLTIACVNPVNHYGLDVGLLREGDKADFIVVKDLENFEIKDVYINGRSMVRNGHVHLSSKQPTIRNHFSTSEKNVVDFQYKGPTENIPVIQAIDGELITKKVFVNLGKNSVESELIQQEDILKITVVNRYQEAPVAVGYINGFGLTKGAIASSVAHDSHNIIAVGTNDEDLCKAVNLLIENKGGLSTVSTKDAKVLPLPIAGLMSPLTCEKVGDQYEKIDALAKSFGTTLKAPFMTLSFMALLVIPEIKISDKGMFDAESFRFY